MKLIDSDFIRIFEALHFKSNLTAEIKEYLAFCQGNLSRLNSKSFDAVVGGKSRVYKSSFILENGQLAKLEITTDDCVFLMCDYFENFNKEYTNKSTYPIGNAIGYFKHPETTKVLERFKDKGLMQICAEDETLGCRFPKRDVRKAYPNLSDSDLEFSYRLSNSLGRLMTFEDLKGADIKHFEVKRELVDQTELSDSKFLSKLNDYIGEFITIQSNEADQILFDALKRSCALIFTELDPKDRDKIYNNEIFTGILYKLLKDYKNVKSGSKTKFDILLSFNARFANDVEKIFDTKVIVDHKEALKNPEILSRDVFDIAILRDIAMRTKMDFEHEDRSHMLDDMSDRVLADAFEKYFQLNYNIYDKEMVEGVVLVFFSFLSTSPGIYERNEVFLFKARNSRGMVIQHEIKSRDFLKSIDTCREFMSKRDSKRNIFRLFCSKRANYAIMVNAAMGFKPRLYQHCAPILDHMRIDFWKGLKVELLTTEEELSYTILKAITEYHSRRDEKSKLNYLKLVGLT